MKQMRQTEQRMKLRMWPGSFSGGFRKSIFKELIQHDCTIENMRSELDRILTDKRCVSAMKADYAKVREILGGEGASEKVAESMLDEYKKLKENDYRGI